MQKNRSEIVANQKVPNLVLRGSRYHVRIEIDGKEYFRSTGCSDLKAAKRRADEIKVELRDGNFGWRPVEYQTFQQWSDKYLKTYTPKKRSAKRDHSIVAHALPVLGPRRLNEITRSDCQAYINGRSFQKNKRGQTPRPGTISREQGLLAAIFQRAVEEGLITSNPWKGIKRAAFEARPRVLSPEEQVALMPELQPEYQRLATVNLGTGLREACLLGLCPKHVDFAQRLIHVPTELAKGGKARDIPIRPEVAEALRTQASEKGIEEDKPYFRKNPSGVRKVFQRAARRANMPHLTVHDLRRTFGTRCALANMPVAVLMRIMGHSSAQVTMKYYVHLQQRDLVNAMDGVDLGLTTKVGAEVVAIDEHRRQLVSNQ